MVLFSLMLSVLCPLSTQAGEASSAQAWSRTWKNLPQLVNLLKTVPEGLDVLRRAERKDPLFAERIKLGEASFTESTFSRTYSLIDGKQQISLRHEVTLNRRLSLANAVVDLAHELVHFTEKGMLDPYRPGFELSQFIRNGIEGEGGELRALAVECKVAWSLERAYLGFPQHRLCERYREPGNAFGASMAKRDYYALGAWFERSGARLQREIPEISANATVFTSSYAAKPYPVALAEEFAMTRRAACENNQRKYRLIASQSASGRQPASSLWEEKRRLKTYDRLYCRDLVGQRAAERK